MHNPKQPKYLFIDGGHLRRHFVEGLKHWDGSATHTDIDFSKLIQSTGAIKSFYYDCQDKQSLPDDYFSGIRKVSGSHVRYGTIKGKSNKREPRQKEVDVLLAVDMMNHAIRRNMGEAILLTGDMDFLPVVEALVEMGCFVTVMADKKHAAQELIDAADDVREIVFTDYYSWSSSRIQSNKLPNSFAPQLKPSEQGFSFRKHGRCNGQELELYYMEGRGSGPPTYYIYQPRSLFSNQPNLNYMHSDLARLELFFEIQFGKIEWDDQVAVPAQAAPSISAR